MASGSTWPWGGLRRLHHQRLCGHVIPAIDLRGYITDLPLIITILLIDRSWAIRGCAGNIFLLLASKPPHSPLMRCFKAILDLSWPKTDYIKGPWAILLWDSKETWNTPYRSKDCEDRRGDIDGAIPSCPFDSINIIPFSNMMKRE
jgi:hypothetical protein